MSSSGLIYAVIVGAWAAYLVPMWLRRQDELNEARPTERFSTAIRLLSGRAGMERRYAKDLRARSADEGEQGVHDPDAITDMVDVRAFAVSQTRPQTQAPVPTPPEGHPEPGRDGRVTRERGGTSQHERGEPHAPEEAAPREERPADRGEPAAARGPAAQGRVPAARRSPDAARRDRSAQAAAERARRSKVLARRRRTITMLFLAFTLGAVVAAVGGLAFLWAPGVPAVLLSAYIAYLRSQERRRFAYQMDRRQAEAAARRLREQPAPSPSRGRRGRPGRTGGPGSRCRHRPRPVRARGGPARAGRADRPRRVGRPAARAAAWPGQGGDSWDPVPVPLPTYVTAPVAPRASGDVDLGAPDTWSSARSSAVPAEERRAAAEEQEPPHGRRPGPGRRPLRRPPCRLRPPLPRARTHPAVRPVRGRRPSQGR